MPPRLILCSSSGLNPDLRSFPTRRSSDLRRDAWVLLLLGYFALATGFLFVQNLWAGLYALVPLVLLTTAMLRSEEHTSELQSRGHLVCRLLLEKEKNRSRVS